MPRYKTLEYCNIQQALEWIAFSYEPLEEEYEILSGRKIIDYFRNKDYLSEKDISSIEKMRTAEAKLKLAIKNGELAFRGRPKIKKVDQEDINCILKAWHAPDNFLKLEFPPFSFPKILFSKQVYEIMDIYDEDMLWISFSHISFKTEDVMNLFQNNQLEFFKEDKQFINSEVRELCHRLLKENSGISNNAASELIKESLKLKPGQYPSKSQVISLITDIIPPARRGKNNK